MDLPLWRRPGKSYKGEKSVLSWICSSLGDLEKAPQEKAFGTGSASLEATWKKTEGEKRSVPDLPLEATWKKHYDEKGARSRICLSRRPGKSTMTKKALGRGSASLEATWKKHYDEKGARSRICLSRRPGKSTMTKKALGRGSASLEATWKKHYDEKGARSRICLSRRPGKSTMTKKALGPGSTSRGDLEKAL